MESAPPGGAIARLHNLEQRVQDQRDLIESRTTEILRAVAANEQRFNALTTQVQQLTATLAQLTTANQPAPAAGAPPAPTGSAVPGPALEPRVGVPERYGGDPDGCCPFITNCFILFALQPQTFATEQAKVAFTVNHLTGKARLWGTAEWDRQTAACASFSAFTAEHQTRREDCWDFDRSRELLQTTPSNSGFEHGRAVGTPRPRTMPFYAGWRIT